VKTFMVRYLRGTSRESASTIAKRRAQSQLATFRCSHHDLDAFPAPIEFRKGERELQSLVTERTTGSGVL
jgi:hypothetical protein